MKTVQNENKQWGMFLLLAAISLSLVVLFSGCRASLPVGSGAKYGTVYLGYEAPQRIGNWTIGDK